LVAAHVHTALTPPNLVGDDITQPTAMLTRVLAKIRRTRFLSYDEFRITFEISRSQLLIAQSQTPAKKPKSTTSWWRRQSLNRVRLKSSEKPQRHGGTERGEDGLTRTELTIALRNRSFEENIAPLFG